MPPGAVRVKFDLCRTLDPAFLALPARELAAVALDRAQQLGAEHADFRLERFRVATLSLRDGQLDSTSDTEDVGLAVRVVHQGAWGFASDVVRTVDAAAALAERAVATAQISRAAQLRPGAARRRAGLSGSHLGVQL